MEREERVDVGRVYVARHWTRTPLVRVLRPIQTFIGQSASSGLVLFAATIVALLMANIPPLAPLYDSLIHAKIGISVGSFLLEESVLHWINDGLMAIFFLLVGLEIKREALVGELSNLRAAALPIVAAIGGAVVPALIYVLFNLGGDGLRGWGVPMATDIAFALGALAILGKRVPFALKVFVTAVAIVDDLIAVLIIAIFYSGGLNWAALGSGLLLLALMAGANRMGFRKLWFYAIPGVFVWLAFLESGVHATVAGVLIALTIPSRYLIDEQTFLDSAYDYLARFKESEYAATPMLTGERQQSAIIALESAVEDIQAPLQKMEHLLHTPVNFLIMPIFAFANAGVALSLESVSGDTMPVALGIVLGLVIGKPVGVLLASYFAVRSGITRLPYGVRWSHMAGAGMLAGIGFTMSLFIATLGFGEGSALLDGSKLAILAASLLAGGLGVLFLSQLSPVEPQGGREPTPVPTTTVGSASD